MPEINYDKIPLYKLVVHGAQIVLSVTIWCLEIVVFRSGQINGQNGWTFGVVRMHAVHTPISCSSNAIHRSIDHLSLTPNFACSASSPLSHGST